MDLSNRSAIITGASQGFGRFLAEAYIRAGANVMLCARGADTLQAAHEDLKTLAPDGQRVLAQTCDVADADEVQRLVDSAIAAFGTVEILVTNAGVYGPKGGIEDVEWEDWTKALEINLYGTLLPVRSILPHFKANGYGKIVNMSGGGATSPMPRISAYAASKAAVVRMTETLAEELRAFKIDVNAVAPGALNTRLLDEVIEAGPDAVGEKFHQKMVQIKDKGGAPMEKGAALCVFLASAASDRITGKLISAIWDDWPDLPNRLDELNSTDVYTLRRIIPMERGFDWGEVE